MVKIRLQRQGKKKAPFYHIVVADSKSPRDGKIIEQIGTYDPMTKTSTIVLNKEKLEQWIKNGAQPTDTVKALLVKSGAIPTKNKKQFLINYFKSQYEQKEYKPVATYPTKLKLLMDWDINVDDYKVDKKVDKERVLALYNSKRKAKFDEEQKIKYQAYIDECAEKYLKDEAFWEFETLQIFVTDENPFTEAYQILNDFSSYSIGDKCVIVGIVSKIQKKKTKKGQQFAFANIYSGDGLIEVTIWPDALQKFQSLIVKGQQVAILGKKDGDERLIVDKIKSYDQWLTDVNKKLNRRKVY